MNIVPFKAEHLNQLVAQDAHKQARKWITPRVTESLEGDYVFSALSGDKVIGCAGIVPIWEGRGMVWAFFSEDIGKHMLSVTRAARRLFQVCPFTRVEAAVECDFELGHRWIKLLGFKLESKRMKKYLPGGEDCALYARIQ